MKKHALVLYLSSALIAAIGKFNHTYATSADDAYGLVSVGIVSRVHGAGLQAGLSRLYETL